MDHMKGRLLLAVVIGIICVFLVAQLNSSDEGRSPNDSGSASAGALPLEAVDTIELIQRDGPFPYDQDGVVFMNRERLLPIHERGYWREYTVPTPGESDRGARRIVHGEGEEFYYTDDHYASFTLVDVPALVSR